jgi:hypothetical protein
MRRVIILLAIAALSSTGNEALAQDKAWSKDSKVLSLGFGLSNFYRFDERFGPWSAASWSGTFHQFGAIQLPNGIRHS